MDNGRQTPITLVEPHSTRRHGLWSSSPDGWVLGAGSVTRPYSASLHLDSYNMDPRQRVADTASWTPGFRS